jgi:cyclopropane fatty-acyl-phospholipid synthase-like methyltransferase
MEAQSQAAVDWWARPREGAQATSWITGYRQSLAARHRDVVVEAVGTLGARSVLEVGCHCGPNLIRLAQADPALSCLGLDVNAGAVAAGTAWLADLGLSARVRLQVGAFPAATAAMEGQCADVVLSVYALAYLSDADLDAALYEVGRLARRGVVLAEPMADAQTPVGAIHTLQGYTEWRHDYDARIPWIGTLRDMTIRSMPIAPPVDRLNAVRVYARA